MAPFGLTEPLLKRGLLPYILLWNCLINEETVVLDYNTYVVVLD